MRLSVNATWPLICAPAKRTLPLILEPRMIQLPARCITSASTARPLPSISIVLALRFWPMWAPANDMPPVSLAPESETP